MTSQARVTQRGSLRAGHSERVTQLTRAGMDTVAAERAAEYEKVRREDVAAMLGDAEPECYGDCEDRYCPYTH